MNRRSLIGMITAAPIAGPAAMKEAASAMTQPSYAASFGGVEAMSGAVSAARSMMEPEDVLRKAYRLGLISRQTLLDALMRRSLLGAYTCVLDPDLQASRSLSLVTRHRMQRDRDANRRIDDFMAGSKSFWDIGHDLIKRGVVVDD